MVPGGRLSSEAAMARLHGVSLGTIQRALGLLADRGIVDRRHGAGTFVKSATLIDLGNATPTEEVKYFRFEPPDGGTLVAIKSRVTEVGITNKHGPWSDFLGANQAFTVITRVVRVDNTYEFLSQIFVAVRSAQNLTRIPVDSLHGASFRRYFRQQHGIVTKYEQHLLNSAIMPAKVRELTGTAQGAIGMEWQIRIFNHSDAPVIFQQNFLPPTDYRLIFQS